MNTITLTPTADPIEARQLAPLMDLWLDEIAAGERMAATTPRTYRYQIRPFALWWSIAAPAHDYQISRPALAEFDRWIRHDYRQANGSPLSAASRAACTRRVKQFFAWAYDRGYAPQPIGRWIPRPEPVGSRRGRRMAPSDLIAMLEAIDGSNKPIRDLALIALLAGTGARRSEIHAARIEAITWHDDRSGALHLAQTKADKPRSVLFGPIVGRLVDLYCAESGRHTGRIFDEIEQSDGIRQVIRRTAARAGVKVTAHSFRRLFASYWYATHPTDDRAAFMLRLLLGHAGRDVTERHYLTLRSDEIRPLYVSPIETPAAAAAIAGVIARSGDGRNDRAVNGGV